MSQNIFEKEKGFVFNAHWSRFACMQFLVHMQWVQHPGIGSALKIVKERNNEYFHVQSTCNWKKIAYKKIASSLFEFNKNSSLLYMQFKFITTMINTPTFVLLFYMYMYSKTLYYYIISITYNLLHGLHTGSTKWLQMLSDNNTEASDYSLSA